MQNLINFEFLEIQSSQPMKDLFMGTDGLAYYTVIACMFEV